MTRPLTIARLKRQTKVLGPGVRAVVWTHGCSRNCPHCIAAEMNRSESHLEFSAEELYEWVRAIDGIEGITISGGEPFEQDLEALSLFLSLVKSDARALSVLCYTGKTLQELKSDPRTALVLGSIDILIDGPYRYELNDGSQWRGSANQKIYSFSDRYKEAVEKAYRHHQRKLELEITSEMTLEITGIPENGFMERLSQNLQKNGYELS